MGLKGQRWINKKLVNIWSLNLATMHEELAALQDSIDDIHAIRYLTILIIEKIQEKEVLNILGMGYGKVFKEAYDERTKKKKKSSKGVILRWPRWPVFILCGTIR